MEFIDRRKQDNHGKLENIAVMDIFITIWQKRWLISIFTLFLMIISLSGAAFMARYKSQGFFQFGGAIPMSLSAASTGIALVDYKRYLASYDTQEHFINFVKEKNLAQQPAAQELDKFFLARTGIAPFVQPVYVFTKLDAKELIDQPRDGMNNVIGLHINYESKDPVTARQVVALLGRYVMDSIIYSIYSDELRARQDETRIAISQLDNILINNKLKLQEYSQKAEDLKQIMLRNPGLRNDNSRQVITVSEETARYLPLLTQLVTTEVQTSEMKLAILKGQREKKQKILLLEYYKLAQAELEHTQSGETILRALQKIKETVFKNEDLQDDAIKEIYNNITTDNQTALNLYLNRSRFIAGPTLPVHSTARLSLVFVISLMAGLLISIFFVFGQKWIIENRKKYELQNSSV